MTRKNAACKSSCKNATKLKKKSSKKSTKKATKRSSSFGDYRTSGNNHLAFGAYANLRFNAKTSSFGALEVPMNMVPVSEYRRTSNPFAVMPFGPPGPWMEEGHPGGASSMAHVGTQFGGNRFGNQLGGIHDQSVNPSGYLSLWNGQPRVFPPSWNPLLLQGQNTFVEDVNYPRLDNVVSFGKKPKTSKTSKKPKVVHSDATTSTGWGKVAKKLKKSEMPKSCFLGPGMKYPICNSKGEIDCRGILAAKQRSRKGTKAHKKATALGKKYNCAWSS